ncbi:MAG: LssY C-terminal domain-containing protein [Candidatus Saccharimonadales bacterium]
MVQYVLRVVKRFAILIPGLIIAYFSVHDIFPYLNEELPWTLAIFITYILAAYVLIPAAIRLIRIIHPPKHLPLYCVTPDGLASDPLNIGIIGTRRELINAMQDAGWEVADRHSLRNMLRLVYSHILKLSYPNAPVSSLYLFGRKQDIAFEVQPQGSSASRHHVRFWATTYDDTKKFSIQTIHWHNRSKHVFGDNVLWVGAASRDVGVSIIRQNFQPSHMIDPDTDTERELIAAQLRKMNLVKRIDTIKLDKPYKLANRVWRGSLHSDGKMKIVTLKRAAIGRHNHNRNQ